MISRSQKVELSPELLGKLDDVGRGRLQGRWWISWEPLACASEPVAQ